MYSYIVYVGLLFLLFTFFFTFLGIMFPVLIWDVWSLIYKNILLSSVKPAMNNKTRQNMCPLS